MNMKKILPLIIISALLVSGVAYAGYRYVQGKKTAAGPQNGQWQNQGGPNSGQKGAGMRRAGGMVAGEISGKGADNLTLKLPEGGSKIVFYSNTTKVVLYSDITAGDLVVGDEVTVIGNKGDGGGITAVSVQSGTVLNKNSAPGAPNGQNTNSDVKNANGGRGGAGTGKMDFTYGQITATVDKGITVKISDGTEKSIALDSNTKYSKISEATTNDLIAGKIVVVIGTANTDGSVTAQSIEIRPELPVIPKQNQLQNAPQKNVPAGQNNQGGGGQGGGARFRLGD